MTATLKKTSSPEKVTPKKVTPVAKARTEKTSKIDAEQRHKMISEAAYYIAEKRGFEGSSTHDDWFAAETEIDAMNKKAK